MRYIPIILSSLIFAAHFLRDGDLAITVIIALMPLLLLLRKAWVPVVLQVLAYAATITWLYTAYDIMQTRIAMGMPYVRMLAILIAVALFSAWSGWLLNTRRVKERFGAGGDSELLN